MQDERYKSSQKMNYDKRHQARTPPSLPDDQPVWVEMRDQQVPGTVLCQASIPRSYAFWRSAKKLHPL